MATAAMMVLTTVLLVAFTVAQAKVYKVGDSAGWTTIGNPDYKRWAATKTFTLGDVIQFQYNPQFHNVMQVKHEDFKACNASTPLATHTSGNDSITITRRGHYFFLCGVPGHCASGQKVDINVRQLRTGVAHSHSPSPSPSTSVLSSPGKPTAAAPGPSISVSSAGASLRMKCSDGVGFVVVAAAAVAMAGLLWL